jgi:hypothetical protein
MPSQPDPEASILISTKSLFEMVLDQVCDYFRLATLELRLTMASIISIMIAAIVLGVIVVSLWIGFQAISIMLLEQIGLTLIRAITLLFFINLLLAGLLANHIRRNFKLVGFDLSISHFASSKAAVINKLGP